APFEEIQAICRRLGATSIRVAADEAERELLWTARRSAFGAAGRLASGFYIQDGVIPRTKLPEVLARINDLAREHGVRVANVFHAGDGNLHPLVLFDATDKAEARRAAEVADLIAVACVEEGGSLTGEHGIGVDKRASLPKMFAETDLATFQLLRCAFDPLQRANPGKVMPTPRLCGEVPGPYRQHPLERAGLAARL
ncbi:MAG: FAD-linked oxidase C-terminal domain-containing protein, partial [Acidimicrobiia bacterium]